MEESNRGRERTQGTQTEQIARFTSEQRQFLEALVEERALEEHKDKFPAFLDREIALTNLNDEDIRYLMLLLSDSFLTESMSRPHFEKDWEFEKVRDQVRAKFFAKVMRSKGGFERENQVKQINVQRVSEEREEASGGFVRGIKKKLGFGKKKRR